MDNEQLNKILARPGYGLVGTIKGGIKGSFKRQKVVDQAGGEGKMSLLERSIGHESLRPKDLAIPDSGRCAICIKVYRRRLTDTGNDCWKYHIDALRYLGMLADDNDAKVSITEEHHEKVESNEEERVEITLTYEGVDFSDLEEYYKDGPKNALK